MNDSYQQEAFRTQVIKHLMLPFKQFNEASTFDIKLSDFKAKKDQYLLFEISRLPLKVALLRNEYGIKFKKDLSQKSGAEQKTFRLLSSLAEFAGQDNIIQQCGQVNSDQILNLMNNPKKVNYIIEKNGKRELFSCVLESHLLKQVANLLPQNKEFIENDQGRYFIKTHKYASTIPPVTELLFNPFYFPVSTVDILNKYLSKHYLRIIQQFFKYKVFNPYYLKPIIKLPLGDFCGHLVKNLKQMKTVLTYNDNLFDETWFTFFFFTFRSHLINYLYETLDVAPSVKCFYNFKQEYLKTYYLLRIKKNLASIFRLIKKHYLHLQLRSALGNTDFCYFYKLFPQYFDFLYSGSFNYEMLDTRVKKTKNEEYNFILRIAKIALQLLAGAMIKFDFREVLKSCTEKELLCYKIFYSCGWEDIASLGAQNPMLFDFFKEHLPEREKEFFLYLSKIMYYKNRGRQEYGIVKQRFLKELKYYIMLNEITLDKETSNESFV